jgi:hypothetical protein
MSAFPAFWWLFNSQPKQYYAGKRRRLTAMWRLRLIAVVGVYLAGNFAARAATHKGASLDDTEYTATARCVTTDQTFEKVAIKFKRDRVNVYFDDGGHLMLRLESEEIADLHHIVAHVTDKGSENITWLLDITTWKETGSRPEDEPSWNPGSNRTRCLYRLQNLDGFGLQLRVFAFELAA